MNRMSIPRMVPLYPRKTLVCSKVRYPRWPPLLKLKEVSSPSMKGIFTTATKAQRESRSRVNPMILTAIMSYLILSQETLLHRNA